MILTNKKNLYERQKKVQALFELKVEIFMLTIFFAVSQKLIVGYSNQRLLKFVLKKWNSFCE